LLGVLGSLAGAALGAAFQVALPPLLKAWLPIELEFRLALLPFVRGMGMGLLTTVLFALWPLLEVRHVRPNLILRRGVADEALGSPGRMAWAISGLLALALAGLALWQAGSWRAAGRFIGGGGAYRLVGDRRERAHRRADVLLHRHPAGSARRVRALACGARPYRRAAHAPRAVETVGSERATGSTRILRGSRAWLVLHARVRA